MILQLLWANFWMKRKQDSMDRFAISLATLRKQEIAFVFISFARAIIPFIKLQLRARVRVRCLAVYV